MRLRGAWCTDRGSLTESRVSSSTARAFFTHHFPIAPRRPRRPRWRRRRTSARACSMKDTGTTKPWRKASRSRTGCARAPRDRSSSSRRRRASDERRTLCRSRPRRPSVHLRSPSPSSLASPPRRRRRANRTSRVGRPRPSARSLSLSRARVLVAVAPLALTHPPSLITPPPTSASSFHRKGGRGLAPRTERVPDRGGREDEAVRSPSHHGRAHAVERG